MAAIAKLYEEPEPNGTEGVVSVKITTTDQAANTFHMKACIIKDSGQYKVLLPACTKENIKEIEAEFYHFRKDIPFSMKWGERVDLEKKCNHQFVPIDLKKTTTRHGCLRKFFHGKTKSEIVQSYVTKYCKLGMDHVNQSDLFNSNKRLFGVQYCAAQGRVKLVELQFSEDRKLVCDDIQLLYPNGPLFHGLKTHRNDQDEYKVKVVGSYSVQDRKISFMLFFEDDQSSADNNSNSSAAIHQDTNVELYFHNLKKAITKQTALLPQRIDLPSLKTNEIFTNLTAYRSKKKSLPEKDREDRRARSSGKAVKQCSEIFVAENGEERNPKSILVSGAPGIGKSLFSHKILRDWSANVIQIPDIQVTYLLNFRQLVQLDDKELTLLELLNLSPLLDEKSQINKTVLEWIVAHPEQLLVVFDGFDEYKNRNMLREDFESQFANDVYIKMPVAALVSKLIRKKIMSESVCMVTSRPWESDKLDQKFHFDKYVDIAGFTETQILEYVEKFFSSKPKNVREMAAERIKKTAHYMTFAQVPLMCFLLCIVMEFEIQNDLTRNYSNSLNLTQFYLEIILSLEKNSKEMRHFDEEAALLAVNQTLDSLATTAAELLERNRFTFTLKDIKMLNLSQNETINLQNSNLIVCYPVAKNSPFKKSTLEYEFAHLTIQEFLAARHYVKMDAMAAVQETSEMFFTFLSGLLGLHEEKNNDEFMLKVLERVSEQVEDEDRRRAVLVRCLYEFGQEKELTRKQLTTNPDYKYWDKYGEIVLDGVTNTDCGGISMLVDKASAASQVDTLHIRFSSLSCSFFNSFLPVLAKPHCDIIRLDLFSCELDDKCLECLIKQVPNTKLTRLCLCFSNITDDGVQYIIDNFHTQLTDLDLEYNPVSHECKERAKQFFKENYPGLDFEI